jgi:cell wall-associated NlpC family hydrolase
VRAQGLALARAAESFAGVPFRFRGRDPRTGLDCAGLVAASLTKLGMPPPPLPPYSMRQTSFAALFASEAAAAFVDVGGTPLPGDLLLVRPGPAQVHLGLVSQSGGLVHAHAGLGKVVVTPPPVPWPLEWHWRLRAD